MLELGGAQQNTLYTVEHLDRAKHDVLLIAGPGGLLDAEARAQAPRVVFVPHLVRQVRPWSDLLALWELWRELRRERPDVVHTHSSKAGILGRLAAFLARVPVRIHTFHGFGFHDRQRPTVRVAYVAAERLCAKLSHALIFVSRANLETARSLGIGGSAQYRVIRSGIDFKTYPSRGADTAALRASVGVQDRPFVVSIGNLKPQKNPQDFVRLAKKVVEKVPTALFYFIGDGELRPRIEALVEREGLKGSCLFPGWRRDAPALLAAADLYAMTSLWEGLPRSLVEALRSGLPCVCYDADGVRDLLKDGHNGFLIRPGDLDGMADKVAAVLADPALRKRLAANAAHSVGEDFDIEGMVKSQEAVYRELWNARRTAL